MLLWVSLNLSEVYEANKQTVDLLKKVFTAQEKEQSKEEQD